MTVIIKPPTNIDHINEARQYDDKTRIFLGGSIEMGKAIDWQAKVSKDLWSIKDLVLFNPRRDDWDSSWEQSIHNKQFKEQVDWELDAQEYSDIIIYNFCADTMSPITLLELGLFTSSDATVLVCCPEGYWRKGNVDIVCEYYDIEVYENLDDLTKYIKEFLL